MKAKNDKKNDAKSLYDQYKAKKWQTGKAQIDQYDLVLPAMQIVRATDPTTLIASFQRVNLKPQMQVDFPVICKKIARFLQAGESFKEENGTPTATDMLDLLPTFWHSMTPTGKKVVMTVVHSHGYHYTVACLSML